MSSVPNTVGQGVRFIAKEKGRGMGAVDGKFLRGDIRVKGDSYLTGLLMQAGRPSDITWRVREVRNTVRYEGGEFSLN